MKKEKKKKKEPKKQIQHKQNMTVKINYSSNKI